MKGKLEEDRIKKQRKKYIFNQIFSMKGKLEDEQIKQIEKKDRQN
jgi:hypothetical protein